MLKIHTWDEIGGEWVTVEIDLPPNTRDPHIINQKLDESLDTDDGYTVASHATTGPILTIECRSKLRNHLAIILVNSEEN